MSCHQSRRQVAVPVGPTWWRSPHSGIKHTKPKTCPTGTINQMWDGHKRATRQETERAWLSHSLYVHGMSWWVCPPPAHRRECTGPWNMRQNSHLSASPRPMLALKTKDQSAWEVWQSNCATTCYSGQPGQAFGLCVGFLLTRMERKLLCAPPWASVPNYCCLKQTKQCRWVWCCKWK